MRKFVFRNKLAILCASCFQMSVKFFNLRTTRMMQLNSFFSIMTKIFRILTETDLMDFMVKKFKKHCMCIYMFQYYLNIFEMHISQLNLRYPFISDSESWHFLTEDWIGGKMCIYLIFLNYSFISDKISYHADLHGYVTLIVHFAFFV